MDKDLLNAQFTNLEKSLSEAPEKEDIQLNMLHLVERILL